MAKAPFPCLWFKQEAAEAAAFYCSIFPNSRVISANGVVTYFELNGAPHMALNAGMDRPFSEAVSLVVNCADQAEIDHYWEALLAGGQPMECGWLKDRYGLCWQIVPEAIGQWMQMPGKQEAVMQVIMSSVKFEIERFEQALR